MRRASGFALAGAMLTLILPAISQAQGTFHFETVPFGTQTSFSETDGGSGVTATFSSLSATPDAFQVLDNAYPPGSSPFYSFNMSGQALIENSAGDHTLQIQFDALQKSLVLSFGLPNAAAQLILEIPSLGFSQTYTGTDLQPLVTRDLPYEGQIVFDAGVQRFDTVTLHTVGATDGAFGIDNVRIEAVPEGSSLAMLALGGLPIAALVLRRRKLRS